MVRKLDSYLVVEGVELKMKATMNGGRRQRWMKRSGRWCPFRDCCRIPANLVAKEGAGGVKMMKENDCS